MDITTVVAIILGLLLKHVVPTFWPKFSSKVIPLVIFVASVAYQLATQMGVSFPGAIEAGALNTAMAVGTYSTAKNLVYEGMFKRKGKK